MLLANTRPQLPSQKPPFGQTLGKCFWQTQSRSYPHKSRLMGKKAAARMTSFTFTCLSFFCMVFSLHELASFVCPLVCGQKGGPPINALYVSYVRGQGLLRFSVLFKFKFLHGHRLSAPSCDTFTASDCTHTITACSCDTFTASTLHAHHHGMLV